MKYISIDLMVEFCLKLYVTYMYMYSVRGMACKVPELFVTSRDTVIGGLFPRFLHNAFIGQEHA